MKLRLYIVTYKRNDVLNENLRTLWASLPAEADVEVKILANHPDLTIAPENQRAYLRVVPNTVRMPFAWGNLTKDWNFGILDGFKNWRNPDQVDWLVLAQNDVQWRPGWVQELARRPALEFISQPVGDQAMALRIDAVRKVGFFDERLTTLHYQEFDYYFRALILLGDKASINDAHEGNQQGWNPVGCFMIEPTATGVIEEENLHTARFHREQGVYMCRKWKSRSLDEVHHLSRIANRQSYWRRHLPEEINWYPFFWDGIPEMPAALRWYSMNLGPLIPRVVNGIRRRISRLRSRLAKG